MLRQEINISNSSAILQQQKPSCIENHVHGNRRVSIWFVHSNDLICTSWKKHVEDYFIAFSIVLKLWKSPSTCFNTATRQSSFNTLNQLLMSHNWTWVKFLLLLSPLYHHMTSYFPNIICIAKSLIGIHQATGILKLILFVSYEFNFRLHNLFSMHFDQYFNANSIANNRVPHVSLKWKTKHTKGRIENSNYSSIKFAFAIIDSPLNVKTTRELWGC